MVACNNVFLKAAIREKSAFFYFSNKTPTTDKNMVTVHPYLGPISRGQPCKNFS
jgi:hypothetical protein